MRKVLVAAIMLSVLASSTVLKAEKKNILVSSYTNVLVDATNNYQVNGQGDIVKYSVAKDNLGVITAIYYTYTKKSGQDIVGQVGPGPKVTDNFIPANSVFFEVVGLERNMALVRFIDTLGSNIYMVFRLVNKHATPTPNRTNPTKHVALVNETCSITNSQILSYIHNPEVVKTVTDRARIANVAVLTTSTDHTLKVGDKVTILSVPDLSYNLNDVEVLSVPTITTFTYSCPGVDEAPIASTGLVYRPEVYNSITVYNHNWYPQASKGIDPDWGALFFINLTLQRYYKGIQPTAESSKFNINILRP